MDYSLGSLGARDFEHLVQALTLASLGPGVKIFGDGPDGGREATFDGAIKIPEILGAGSWSGYGIVQAKHPIHPGDPRQNAKWLIGELRDELNAFLPKDGKPPKRKKPPKYYLAVTSARLSSVEDRGGIDLVEGVLEEYSEKLGLVDYRVWHYDQLARLLDDNSDIRQTYAGAITSGDLIEMLLEVFGGGMRDIGRHVSVNAAVDLRERQWVRLGDSGLESEAKLPLDRVAIDLPAAIVDSDGDQIVHILTHAVKRMLILGAESMRRSHRSGGVGVLMVGGPGQGKSTLAQILCQTYRAALLEASSALLDEQVRLVAANRAAVERMGLELPNYRRWPIYVELSEYADALAGNPDLGLLTFLAGSTRVHGEPLLANQLAKWRKAWPWVVVLDGLDEVSSLDIRAQMIGKINEFITDSNFADDDVMVIATTRPQGYHGEFGEFGFEQIELSQFAPHQALAYAELLTELRLSDDPTQRRRVGDRLKSATENDVTSKLMTTPLQVTIMATLLEQIQRVPETRHALFDAYYRAIYARETGRAGRLGDLLARHQPVIDFVHEQVGLHLQIQAERDGLSDALLEESKLVDLFRKRLIDDGHGDEAEDLAKELLRASRNRVVLIVGARQDHVGFEVRSIQEYMAARALTNEADETVLRSLQTIAPSAHWRNTYLLAAGRLLTNTPRLLDPLLGSLDLLNDSSYAGLVVGTGRRLALDLLDDDFARDVPRIRLSLLQKALGALDEWVDPQLRRLARVAEGEWVNSKASGAEIKRMLESAFASSGREFASAVAILRTWEKSNGPAGALSRRLLASTQNWRPVGDPKRPRTRLGTALRPLLGSLDDETRDTMVRLFNRQEVARNLTASESATFAKAPRPQLDPALVELVSNETVMAQLEEILGDLSTEDAGIAIAIRHVALVADERRQVGADLSQALVNPVLRSP